MKRRILVFSVMISAVVATAGCSAPHGASMVQELPGLAVLESTFSTDDAS